MFKINFIYKEEYQHPISMLLILTDDCNLTCKYCFVEQHPHFMNLQTAKDAVDWLNNNILWQREYYQDQTISGSLCLFGGEPMLMFDTVIKPLLEYIENNYKNNFIITMTTNGTLLNFNNLSFLSKHLFNIMLSCDGFKAIQDLNRPCKNNSSSYDLIEQNIPYLLEFFPNAMFRSTISGLQDQCQLFEIYQFVETLGFHMFFAMPDHRHLSIWTLEKINDLKQNIQKIYQYRLNQFLNYQQVMDCSFIDEAFNNIMVHDIHIINQDINQLKNNKKIEHCAIGISACSIGYDGNIYSCQEQPTKDIKNIFCIGNIYNNFINKNKHINLINTYLDSAPIISSNKDQCQKCLLAPSCNIISNCISTSYDLFNNFNTMSQIRCIWKEENLKNAIISMKILVDNNNEYFDKYLKSHVLPYKLCFI